VSSMDRIPVDVFRGQSFRWDDPSQTVFRVGVYDQWGQRISSNPCDSVGSPEMADPQVLADALAHSWPGMQVCVWLDLSVRPAARLADNAVSPDAIGST
jgi:hypothetical protein